MHEIRQEASEIKHLRYFRKKARLTQIELANMLGVDETTIRRWEKGRTAPTVSDIKKLCEVLGCTESELLNGLEEVRWNLKVMYSSEMPVLNIPAGKILSDVHIVDNQAMSVTLSGPFELWEDETKFEDFIQQLRREREIGLNVKKARESK